MNFGYIWEEIVFLEGLVKLREIRNIEDFQLSFGVEKSFSFFYPFLKPLQISFKFR